MSVNIVDKTTGNLIKVAGNPVEDASGIHYSHTTSGLAATNVQDAIDESYDSLKSGLTTLDTEVNGDATVYPYADVITIPDAVPANLADCSVKIEPVQDLHGYDKPWVGGANKNKINIADKASSTSGDVTASCSNGVITLSGTASAQTTFSFPLGSDINLTPSLYKIAYNNTAASSYIAIKFCNNGSVIHSWTPNVVNRVISDWTATEDETIDEIKIEIANGYPTNMTLSIVVMDKDGTDTSFSPYSNICPISGHTEASVQRDGRNLFDGVKYLEGRYYENGGRVLNANYDVYKYVLPVGNYVVKHIDNTTGLNNMLLDVDNYDNDGNCIGYESVYYNSGNPAIASFSVDAETAYVYISIRNSAEQVQLEIGTQPTAFEPYQGKTYTIALGDTIYKGLLDVDTGVMTPTHTVVDMGTLSWTKIADGLYRAEQSGMKNTADNEIADMLCETYFPDMYSRLPEGSIALRYTNQIWVRDNTVADATELTTNLDGKKLCYPLGTPTTIQLTPQQIQLLKGTNTLTASTGQISVTVNGVSGAIGAVQEQVNEIAEDVAVLDNLITNDFVTVADGFYCEDAYKAKYTAISNGTHGIVQINGVVKASSALTASTDYTICSVPFTSIREAFGLEFNESGTIAIDKDSGDVVYTPSASVAQYTPIKFSIAFCF